MTFNGISWGYVDSEQASPYSYSPQQIINMLNTCTSNGGNLLLNFGPAPDGSVPPEAIEPLRKVGIWLKENGEAVYGEHTRQHSGRNIWDLNFGGTSVSVDSAKDNIVYVWQRIWPRSGKIVIGGYFDAPKSVSYLATGEKINFTYEDRRITLHDLPTENPDKNVGIPVIRLEFETVPKYLRHSHYPQVHSGLCFD